MNKFCENNVFFLKIILFCGYNFFGENVLFSETKLKDFVTHMNVADVTMILWSGITTNLLKAAFTNTRETTTSTTTMTITTKKFIAIIAIVMI